MLSKCVHRLSSARRWGFCVFCFGTMHTGWAQNKTHETSTSKRKINGVLQPIWHEFTTIYTDARAWKSADKLLFSHFFDDPSLNTHPKGRKRSIQSGRMEIEMNEKGMMGELIGSLAVTLLVFGDWAGTSEHGSAAAAGVAGVTLAIMWMTFKGSEILPIITIMG